MTSIRDYANQYNGGLIPKNLQCIQSVGIDNISKSLFTGREESFNQNNLQSQRSSVTNIVVPPQQTTVVNGGFVHQRPSIVGGNTVNPVLYQSKSLQPTGPVLTQPPQPVQGQIIQQILPPQIPIQQVPIQHVPVQQIPPQNAIQQRFIQSQVQTVRPVQTAQQTLFRAP